MYKKRKGQEVSIEKKEKKRKIGREHKHKRRISSNITYELEGGLREAMIQMKACNLFKQDSYNYAVA